ncbi:MAG: ABC transporter permease [Rhodothermales bacterium]|nr:ABC transporter permease [Rhodothermales bacterium]
MRTIRFILQKEFLQIFRNRAMLPIIFVMPVVQLLVLSFAATFDVKTITVTVVDNSNSPESQRMITELSASGYFEIVSYSASMQEADESMLRGDAQMILGIPSRFGRDLQRIGQGDVQIIINAEDGATAGIIQAYSTRIFASLGQKLRMEEGIIVSNPPVVIISEPRHWYNPGFRYTTYMVPGILVVLVTMIGMFLSSMNVVREKEIGTIEQLNVTPIKKHQFIVGKLLPFWLLALVELAIGLVIARIVFDLPMVGSLFLVFGVAGVYLIVMLGIGLWISTMTNTQQQAMFIAWFFVVIFILLSGLFTPVESMPLWAQQVNRLNPIAYFIDVMRRVMLTGAGLVDVLPQVVSLVVFAVVVISLAVRRHRKVVS